MEDWLSHTGSAVAGAAAALLPVWFWFRKQSNSLASMQQRDAYEMEKIRRSDAYQELLRAVEDGRRDRDNIREEIILQNARIAAVQESEVACLKRSSDQAQTIYEQDHKIRFLENRIIALEAMIANPSASAVAAGLTKLAQAAVKSCSEDTPGCPPKDQEKV